MGECMNGGLGNWGGGGRGEMDKHRSFHLLWIDPGAPAVGPVTGHSPAL